jgi:hypothetical protein
MPADFFVAALAADESESPSAATAIIVNTTFNSSSLVFSFRLVQDKPN